jgi:hypothetical protein
MSDKLIIGKDKPGPQISKGNPKPKDVKILPPVNVIPGGGTMGQGIQLMIFGLGDDNIIYTYHMREKVWYDKL